jgi:peptidoglycan hydrolase-like protein with peptidoglycan-binding domain
MKPRRLALLVLASVSLAGLGVPASFGLSKNTTPNAPKKKSAAGKPAASNASAKNSPTKNSSAKGHGTATTTSAKRPVNGGAAAKPGSKAGNAKLAAGKSPKSGKKPAGKGPRSRKQTGQKAPTSDRITEIQTALAREGAYSGSPTGSWDDQTSAAMRKYQSTHGLTANGRLDAPTLHRLGLGSQTAGVAAPTPPPGAVSRLSSSNAFAGNSDTPQQ